MYIYDMITIYHNKIPNIPWDPHGRKNWISCAVFDLKRIGRDRKRKKGQILQAMNCEPLYQEDEINMLLDPIARQRKTRYTLKLDL